MDKPREDVIVELQSIGIQLQQMARTMAARYETAQLAKLRRRIAAQEKKLATLLDERKQGRIQLR